MILGITLGITGRPDKELFCCSYPEYQEKRTSSTFFDDFSIAERFGIDAVSDTFNRAFNEWKSDYKMLTELVFVLNAKIWHHNNEGDEDLVDIYLELYEEAHDYAYTHLTKEELDFYFHVLD